MRKIRLDNPTEKPIYFDEIYLLSLYMLEAVSLDQLRVFIAAASERDLAAIGDAEAVKDDRAAHRATQYTAAQMRPEATIAMASRAGKLVRRREAERFRMPGIDSVRGLQSPDDVTL